MSKPLAVMSATAIPGPNGTSPAGLTSTDQGAPEVVHGTVAEKVPVARANLLTRWLTTPNRLTEAAFEHVARPPRITEPKRPAVPLS